MTSKMRSIVRNGGKGRMGLGIEIFRLDAVSDDELTSEEIEAAEESKEKRSETAVMRIYEEIGEDFWTGNGITAKKFIEELESFGEVKRLNIHINSLGGDVFTAQTIHSIILDHDSKKTAYIDGIAASAATVIACAADEVIARYNTNYMIHHPWAMAIGNAETMRKAAEDLEQVTVPIVSVYKTQVKGKIDENKIRELMEGETWMTAEQALEYGFVDKVRGKIRAIAKVGKSQISCSGRVMDVGKYHYQNVPSYPIAKVSPEKPKQTSKITMNKEDIDPELLASVTNEAATAERTRLAALDAMNGPGLGEIIAKAKTDGKQPNDIAMECLTVTRAQLSAADATSALKRDAQAASTVHAGNADNPSPSQTKINKAKSLVAEAFARQRPKAVASN